MFKPDPKAKKRFGQNFLCDESIIDRIVQSFDAKPNERILEIGPGRGALTRKLLASGAHLDVIEIDRDLVQHLSETIHAPHFHLHEADALHFSVQTLDLKGQTLRILGNLPYNISTPLLFHLLTQKTMIKDMLFMLQKEVVERMVAEPGTKAYGRLSVALQLQCKITALFSVPPQAFNPIPKVQSQIVYLQPYTQLPFALTSSVILSDLLRDAFNQRRKVLHNSLHAYFKSEDWKLLGIDPRLRAENITVAQWVHLANVYCSMKNL